MNFPFDGEFFRAPERRHRAVVFFVHFYLGHKRQLRRHIQLVNDLGFDAFAFHLRPPSTILHPPVARRGRFGLKHVYADQISLLLDRIEGPKIVFSFSNPTAAAIEALAERGCRDVVALVADSGPTAKFVPSAERLYSQGELRKPPLFRLLAVPLLSLAWSPRLHRDLPAQLETFPDGFPVLSVRGGRDPLIPPEDIAAVFDGRRRLKTTVLDLPQAGHLTALKEFPELYGRTLRTFVAGLE